MLRCRSKYVFATVCLRHRMYMLTMTMTDLPSRCEFFTYSRRAMLRSCLVAATLGSITWRKNTAFLNSEAIQWGDRPKM